MATRSPRIVIWPIDTVKPFVIQLRPQSCRPLSSSSLFFFSHPLILSFLFFSFFSSSSIWCYWSCEMGQRPTAVILFILRRITGGCSCRRCKNRFFFTFLELQGWTWPSCVRISQSWDLMVPWLEDWMIIGFSLEESKTNRNENGSVLLSELTGSFTRGTGFSNSTLSLFCSWMSVAGLCISQFLYSLRTLFENCYDPQQLTDDSRRFVHQARQIRIQRALLSAELELETSRLRALTLNSEPGVGVGVNGKWRVLSCIINK